MICKLNLSSGLVLLRLWDLKPYWLLPFDYGVVFVCVESIEILQYQFIARGEDWSRNLASIVPEKYFSEWYRNLTLQGI